MNTLVSLPIAAAMPTASPAMPPQPGRNLPASDAPAIAPAAGAGPSSDPIFALIEKHRNAETAWKAAVHAEFGYEKGGAEVREMKDRARKAYERKFNLLQFATSDAGDRMHEASTDLVNTPPTSLAGIKALCEYIGPLLDDTESNLPDSVEWDDGTNATPGGALANAIRSAVTAMMMRTG